MATLLVVHGAWSAGWSWKKVRPMMRELGHELITPTLTGLGDRSHLVHAGIDLETHVADIMAVVHYEDLHEVTLVGHSYGGMVATVVADRLALRLARLVYLDAFVPRNGQSLLDLLPAAARESRLHDATTSGQGWLVSPNPSPADLTAADVEWVSSRRVKQPLETFRQPARLTGAVDRLPRTYVYCKRSAPGDQFRQFAERAKADPGWTLHEMDASHTPNVTAPAELAALLDRIVSEPAPV
jgi:pimeloyl-ACP methyl ester carboxylesterase